MKYDPRVSIVLPVHNNEHTVGGALRSLVSQSLTDIEVIVVLDGCSDASIQEVGRIAEHDHRVRILMLEENVGVMEARARGIAEATAPFVGFADSDDLARPDMYEILLARATSDRADIVICGADRLSAERVYLGRKVSFSKNAIIKRKVFDSFCSLRFGSGVLWNKLYRKEVIQKYGMTRTCWRQDTSEDTIVNIGCFLEAERVVVIKDSLYEYIEREGSATAYADNAGALVELVRGYAAALELYSKHGPEVLAGITRLYLKQSTLQRYKVEDPGQFVGHEERLGEAMRVILGFYPAGLVVVAPDREICRSHSVRQGISNIKTEFQSLTSAVFARLRDRSL